MEEDTKKKAKHDAKVILGRLSPTAQSFEPKAVSAGRQSPSLSATARPFSPLSASAQSFQPKISAAAHSFQPKTAHPIVDLSSEKHADNGIGGGDGGSGDEVKLYVGNLNYATDETRLREFFGAFGTVTDAFLPMERGHPRGFGFVTFASRNAAEEAISKMNQSQLDGRTIQVNESKPRMEGASNASRKAVVVEISSKKHAIVKAPAPAALPGMEYLVGVDDARMEAEKKARLEENKRAKEAKEEAKLAAEEKARQEEEEKAATRAAAAEAAAKQHAKLESCDAEAKKPVPDDDGDEMPGLDEMMAVLEMSKEDRQKKLDEMFGME
ncbi:hypothetical protein ACHAXR_007225 [Thalassiosira sp. AJA248-18]